MSPKTLVTAWEDGSLPKPEWTHAAHLTVAAWFVWEEGIAALDRVRTGIQHYNAAVGIISTPDYGYHETITRFWIYRLAEFFRDEGPFAHRDAAVDAAVSKFAVKRNWYGEYWSINIINSREARATWLPPDLRHFDI